MRGRPVLLNDTHTGNFPGRIMEMNRFLLSANLIDGWVVMMLGLCPVGIAWILLAAAVILLIIILFVGLVLLIWRPRQVIFLQDQRWLISGLFVVAFFSLSAFSVYVLTSTSIC